MGKLVWIALGLLVAAGAAYGAYSFVRQSVIAPQAEMPRMTEEITNPATVFCNTLQGKVERRGISGVGICVLPDGRECEEQVLYERNECVLP